MSGFFNLNFLNAQWEVVTRFMEFDQNLRDEFAEFWSYYLPALQDQTAQIHTAELNQITTFGDAMDATLLGELDQVYQARQVELHRRHRPSDYSCQLESVKATLPDTEHMTRALANATNWEGIRHHSAEAGTPSAEGEDHVLTVIYDEMRAHFCTPGRPGCSGAPAGVLPYGDVQIVERARGARLTRDLINDEVERIAHQRVIENFVSPRSQPVIPREILQTVHAENSFVFARRPQMARKSLLRYVVAETLSAGVSGPENMSVYLTRTTDAIADPSLNNREPAGHVNPAMASQNPSRREIEEAQRERLLSEFFFQDAVTDPDKLLRQMADLKEQQLRAWVRIKRTNERRVALMAAELGMFNETFVPMPASDMRPEDP
ncbi:MAG: hypothetical protein EA357_08725 [Micavibrio sp.]|nr:MAG: hypothetical protein EA357_08725 [Micavibrio sp.]